MRELLILSVGPHACEMADLVTQINAVEPTWDLLGFLVPDTQAALGGSRPVGAFAVVGTYADLHQYPQAHLGWAFGCGFPGFPAERVATLVAPSAFVASTATIGRGCVIYPNCFIGHNTRLGDRVFVLAGSVINHDVVIEEDVTIATHVAIAGSVHVEAGCYLGQSSTVRQLQRIGAGSLLGMGAVVVADVPAHAVMVGNPARQLRQNTPR